MKGIDTNVLIRYIVQDDLMQSAKAAHFIEMLASKESPIFITGIIFCELVWVLETAYEYSKKDIAQVLDKILRIQQFHVHQPEAISQALHDYQTINVDFSDSYLAHLNKYYHCSYTATFDKKAARLKLFKLLN